jgi:transcriptional regulator with XRE-family HTH domain
MTESDVVTLLRKRQANRTAKELAEEIGITPQYLSDIFALRRLPGKTVLEFLGIEKSYTRKAEQ